MSPKDILEQGSVSHQEYERLLALIEDVPCAVWEIETNADGRSQRFTYLSHSVEKLLGHPYEELKEPSTWTKIVHPDDLDFFLAQTKRMFAEGDHTAFRHRIIAADGRVIPIEAILHLVRDGNGVPRAIRGVTLDVSERYRSTRRWKFLAEASEILAGSMDLEETLQRTTKLLVPEVADLCTVHLIQANEEVQRLAVAASTPELEAMSRESSERFPAKPETRKMILDVLASRQSYVIEVTDEFRVQHSTSPEHLELMRTMDFRSVIISPLFVGEQLLGVVALSTKGDRPVYTEEDRLFVEELARRIALAIYNARLLAEARNEASQRKFLQERMEFLARASAILAGTVDAESALRDLGEFIVPRLADICVIVLCDTNGTVRPLAIKSEPASIIGVMRELVERFPNAPDANSGLQHVLRTREPEIHLTHDDDFLRSISQNEEHFQLLRSMDIASSVFYPLEAHDNLYGAILLGFAGTSGRLFKEDDIAFVEEISRRASLSIYKARLYEEAKEDLAHRTTLQDRLELTEAVSEAVAGSLDVKELLDRAAAVICPRYADWMTVDIAEEGEDLRRIFLHHSDENLRERAEAYRVKYQHEVTAAMRDVMQTNTPLYIPDGPKASRKAFGMSEERWKELNELGVSSLIMMPLRSRRRTLGVLGLDMGHSGRHFTAADIELANEIASRLAAGIDNALLYAEAHREIRRRAELQQSLEEAKEAMEVASRTKDQFIAALSHELRTPLTPVMATVDLLSDDTELPESLRPFIDLIRRNIEIEARLIDDLLDMTRITKGKLRLTESDVDIHALIPDVIDICRRDLDRNKLRIVTQFHASNFYVRGDRDRLSQVLWNVLHNSIKFTPESGLITIRTRNDNNGNVQIEVQDTGRGIEAGDLKRIFDPFEQDANARTSSQAGLGLGLAISRTIVEMHGGSIEAKSEGIGQGSIFIIRLKASELKPAKDDTAKFKITNAKGGRILMVDDHIDTNAALKVLLERRGYTVTTAGSVAHGLELSRKHQFDILVSDIGLPDGDGTDLLTAIRRERPMRAIAVSGYGTEADIARSLEAGFEYHLKKPIAFPELERAIAEILS